ncbi:SURF1 family protein, partial [Mesorhizobium sp. M1A.T.Ca.IN.004.03.1.1]
GQISGLIEITGLMRMTEPKGSLLQSNDVAADRWYSRDVAAIAQKRGLGAVAPYFIDADAAANPGGLPVGGLTVIRF